MLHRRIGMHLLRRGITIGVAGAAGLAIMELVRRKTAAWVKPPPKNPMDVFSSDRSLLTPLGTNHLPDESATAALGRIAYEKLTGEPPSDRTKEALSWAIHIGYGLLVTALFATVRERPRVLRDGIAFGTGLWLFGDEIAVPLLGLADKPSAYSTSHHAQALAQHLGFGVATAAATRALEALS